MSARLSPEELVECLTRVNLADLAMPFTDLTPKGKQEHFEQLSALLRSTAHSRDPINYPPGTKSRVHDVLVAYEAAICSYEYLLAGAKKAFAQVVSDEIERAGNITDAGSLLGVAFTTCNG